MLANPVGFRSTEPRPLFLPRGWRGHALAERAVLALLAGCSARKNADPQQALRVLWVLKDADGLDRVRLEPHDGLNPKKLRFECSKRMQAEARETFRVIP